MSKLDPRGRPSADRTSLYDEITDKILAEPSEKVNHAKSPPASGFFNTVLD